MAISCPSAVLSPGARHGGAGGCDSPVAERGDGLWGRPDPRWGVGPLSQLPAGLSLMRGDSHARVRGYRPSSGRTRVLSAHQGEYFGAGDDRSCRFSKLFCESWLPGSRSLQHA